MIFYDLYAELAIFSEGSEQNIDVPIPHVAVDVRAVRS